MSSTLVYFKTKIFPLSPLFWEYAVFRSSFGIRVCTKKITIAKVIMFQYTYKINILYKKRMGQSMSCIVHSYCLFRMMGNKTSLVNQFYVKY